MLNRIGGIVSGLDTHELIEQLMRIERQPIITMEARKRVYNHRKDLWNQINTNLLNLKNKAYDLTRRHTFEKISADLSNEGIIKAQVEPNAVNASYKIEVENLATNLSISGRRFEDIDQLNIIDEGTKAFTIRNGEEIAEITVDAEDSLRTIMRKINRKEELGISATIIDNTLVLTRDEVGKAEIEFDGDIDVLQGLGILDDMENIANVLQDGKNAKLTINGLEIEKSSNVISDVLEGVTLTLTGVGETTLDVGIDVDGIYSEIEDFVKQYNSLIELINTRLAEEKVKAPQTEGQERMGLLRGDINLITIKGNLRQGLYNVIPDLEYNLITKIGISTSSEDFGKSGKLEIDEEKLKSAIRENPDAVRDLFAINEDDRKGIAVNIEKQLHYLTRPIDGIITTRLKGFDGMIRDIDNQIENRESRLEDVERNYWAKFTAMERALSTMYNQSQWLTNQLAQLSGQ